jgi:hypothetical protein
MHVRFGDRVMQYQWAFGWRASADTAVRSSAPTCSSSSAASRSLAPRRPHPVKTAEQGGCQGKAGPPPTGSTPEEFMLIVGKFSGMRF